LHYLREGTVGEIQEGGPTMKLISISATARELAFEVVCPKCLAPAGCYCHGLAFDRVHRERWRAVLAKKEAPRP
jgi:hypothetical protein